MESEIPLSVTSCNNICGNMRSPDEFVNELGQSKFMDGSFNKLPWLPTSKSEINIRKIYKYIFQSGAIVIALIIGGFLLLCKLELRIPTRRFCGTDMLYSDFYVELPSNSAENNTIANYVTKLAKRLYLSDEWEVGLAEINYTYSWYNVTDDERIRVAFFIPPTGIYYFNTKAQSQNDAPTISPSSRSLNIITAEIGELYTKYHNKNITEEEFKRQKAEKEAEFNKLEIELKNSLESTKKRFAFLKTNKLAVKKSTNTASTAKVDNSPEANSQTTQPVAKKLKGESLIFPLPGGKIGEVFSGMITPNPPSNQPITTTYIDELAKEITKSTSQPSVERIKRTSLPPQTTNDLTYVKLPEGNYMTEEQLVKAVNNKLNKFDVEIPPLLKYQELIQKVIVLPGKQRDWVIWPVFGNNLRHMLGLGDVDYFSHDRSTDPIKANFAIQLSGGFHSLYVYCDVVATQIVGNTTAKLLRTVEVPANLTYGQQVTLRYDNPHYVPLAHREFETIEIHIKDDSNRTIPFQIGRSRVKLHFRKKSQR